MYKKIKNAESILSHGCIDSKKVLLDLVDEVLWRLDSYEQLKKLIKLENNILKVGNKSWDLCKKKNIYLIGAGKACNHMARAVDEILGNRLTKGIAIIKIKEDIDVFNKTDIYIGGHPLPNEEGYRACQKIIELVDNAKEDDLFITVISGGSSALMSCPIDGISLDDEIKTTDIMLKSGANIYEINSIRRHISKMNGGMLAKRIASKNAEMIGIGISDGMNVSATKNIYEPYTNYKGTPIGPDDTTLEMARKVIKNYNVEDKLPKSVVDYIMNIGIEGETPKSFSQNTYFLINSVPDSCRVAMEIAKEKGINSMILTSYINGESKDIGLMFSAIARQIKNYETPIKPPCFVFASGETYTTIEKNSIIKGHGGPSQELVLGFALTSGYVDGATMLSIDSEGTDGTTKVAGGITDSKSLKLMEEKGVDLYEALRVHGTYEALDTIGDVVFTGNTGTNLCDFDVLYVPKK